jgi:hypothetical protein
MGKKRTFTTAFFAVIMALLSVWQVRLELGIMAALLGFISYQFYVNYSLSKQVFDSLEELNKQFNKLDELPE